MAPARRFLSTVVTTDNPGEGIFQNTTGKPLSVTLAAQAISTDRNACMSVSVGLGTTAFSTRTGIASGNFCRYFGTQSTGTNPIGFSTVHGTFYLGKDCNCAGGSYCSSTSGIASFLAADGTETKNWQAGNNQWGCCICMCAGQFPDTSCSSWCANAFYGGQEQINYGLSFYNEYTGLCWSQTAPFSSWGNDIGDYESVHVLGYTNGGTCMFQMCRANPTHSWILHGCHASDPCTAAQVWVNPYCCCGRCNYENNAQSTMGICYGYNNAQCGGYFNWYAITNNQPDVVCRLWCCAGSCITCMCTTVTDFQCYTSKVAAHHDPGDVEVHLHHCARAYYMWRSCWCNQCGRWCREQEGCCCISAFTDCYSLFCCMCCWQHWDNGWSCNHTGCPMNPYGGVAGAATQCAIVRHHKTMGDCQMYFIGNMKACSWYCQRCSCYLKMLDLWVDPPKYGDTQCCTNEYSIKYLSWNPQKCCTYLAIRSKKTEHCGIYSWFGSGQAHEYRNWQVNPSSGGNFFLIYPCDTTYFTKVSDWPTVWDDPKYYTPIMCTTCIHRVEKCLWAMGVYNCDDKQFDPFITSDLISWKASPSPGSISETVICDSPNNCIVEYMTTDCVYRISGNYDSNVCREGILDWKLSFNNYERTGVILDCGDRLFVNNIENSSIGTSFNFQVWGYEG